MTQIGRVRDASVVLNGADQVALPLNGNRQFLAIHNPTGNAAAKVNLVGTDSTAAPGTIDIAAGGSIILDHWAPQNAIHVSGTDTQTLVVLEG